MAQQRKLVAPKKAVKSESMKSYSYRYPEKKIAEAQRRAKKMFNKDLGTLIREMIDTNLGMDSFKPKQ